MLALTRRTSYTQRFSIISPHDHFTPYHFTPYHFTPHYFTPRSFYPKFISPHVHFTPHLSNASQIKDYCHPISILSLIEKRLGSNYQLDKQTMLSMWTTKSEPKSFTYRNCNTSEQGAQKNHFFCQSKSTTMDAANLQQKSSYRPETSKLTQKQ